MVISTYSDTITINNIFNTFRTGYYALSIKFYNYSLIFPAIKPDIRSKKMAHKLVLVIGDNPENSVTIYTEVKERILSTYCNIYAVSAHDSLSQLFAFSV